MGKIRPIWDVIKNKLGIQFHSKSIYEQKYLKTSKRRELNVREFDVVIKTKFLGDGVPKWNMHYTHIACITTDSVMRIEKKKSHLQVYLEEAKYKIKKIQMSKFINA